MRRISDPDFVYQPWEVQRRQAARRAAAVRIYGSIERAEKVRAEKLRVLLVRRAVLKKDLGRLQSTIRHFQKQLAEGL